MTYEEYKAEVLRIMREEYNFPENIIADLATEADIQFGYNNEVTPRDTVFGLVF